MSDKLTNDQIGALDWIRFLPLAGDVTTYSLDLLAKVDRQIAELEAHLAKRPAYYAECGCGCGQTSGDAQIEDDLARLRGLRANFLGEEQARIAQRWAPAEVLEAKRQSEAEAQRDEALASLHQQQPRDEPNDDVGD